MVFYDKIYLEILLFSLTQLQILQLQYNEISIIGNQFYWYISFIITYLGLSLVYLIRLQSLRLDSNKLSIIRPDELLKLSQLKILDLSDCPIENLDVKILKSFFP